MKKSFKPLMILGVCLAVAVALILILLLADFGGRQEETFRTAKVIAVDGSATLRRGEDSMDVYQGLTLRDGDQITTAAGGRVDLRLDTDKYVVLEESTAVRFQLEGDPRKGIIRLYQTAGTVHHTIENPLAQADRYEVHTPDAVMAVRGTDFLTNVSQTENGTQTSTEVQAGIVEMKPNNQQESPQTLGPGESATAETVGDGPAHFLVACPACAQPVQTLQEHLLSCAEDHYSCEGSHVSCGEENRETELTCGHLAGTEGDHESKRPCGHYICADGDHEKLSCGNYMCQPGHGARGCGHCICAGIAEGHSWMPCGHYTCNMEDMGHYLLPCGNYDCRGNGHACCYGCEGCICVGDHSQLLCGHLVCMGGTHDPRPCGHFTCDEGSHDYLTCGHYACDGRIHDGFYSCGNLFCAEGHGDCVYCGQCMCTGQHGKNICNTAE